MISGNEVISLESRTAFHLTQNSGNFGWYRLVTLVTLVTLFDLSQNTNNDKTRQSHKSK